MKPKLFNGTDWIEFETEAEHNAYVASITPPSPPDYHAIVDEKRRIGDLIIREYLADNTAINLTKEQSFQQLQKFQIVKEFLSVGNLEDAKDILHSIQVDDVVTQERKEKYIAMFP